MNQQQEERHIKHINMIRDMLTDKINNEHYKKLDIEPIDYILANKMNFCEGNIIKYVSRYKEKGGKEDLLKAKEYLEILIKKL